MPNPSPSCQLAALCGAFLLMTTAAPAAEQPPATLLLITAEELEDAWSDFAEWKTKTGRSTRILTVAEIADRYEADNLQEKIRLCVRDHIDNHGTKWVLLGGDSLPGGKGLIPGGHTTTHQQHEQQHEQQQQQQQKQEQKEEERQ